MLLGLPGTVWAVLGIEFVERLGYYAVAFSLFTYCTVMLKTGPSVANAILNVVYIFIPAAAFLAAGVADSDVGRPRVLARALVLYTFSLLMLFVSASPGLYGDFPKNPLPVSKFLFAMSLIGFSVGYGSMKVCTNPIMADCVVLLYCGHVAVEESGEDAAIKGDGGARDGRHGKNGTVQRLFNVDGCGVASPPAATRENGGGEDSDECPSALVKSSSGVAEPGLKEGEAEKDLRFAYGSIQGDDTATATAATAAIATALMVESPNADLDADASRTTFEAQQEQQALSRLFIYAYWISNVGGLIGSFVAPLLRNGESRRAEVGSETHSTGYYYSFLLATFSVGMGGIFLLRCYHWLPHNAPAPNYVLVRVLVAAVVNRWCVFRRTKELANPAAPPPRDWLDYACAELRTTATVAMMSHGGSEATVAGEGNGDGYIGSRPSGTRPASDSPPQPNYSVHSVTTAAWVDDCRATLRVCKAFVALPIYWLPCNQFSTNLMYQATALNLPSSVPEELFNNINTVTMLVFLALWDQWVVPRVLQHRVPSACLRIVGGFLCMCASMVWCGCLQCAITHRGYYEGADCYVVMDGYQKLSAGWLIMPYMLQGLSSALVDPTVMEVAYRDAPVRMKGTVMGLYWVASSASGFLGLALSPIMKPRNATALFFVFATAQMVVSALFYLLNCDRAY